LGGKPDALTWRPDFYPQGGDGAYALANPQNMQQLFKYGQLVECLRATSVLQLEVYLQSWKIQLWATILDQDQFHMDIMQALQHNEIAKSQ
jgi:hypothetical protein